MGGLAGLENNPTRAGRVGWRGFRPLGRRGRDRRGGRSLTSRKNCLDRALASVRSAENTGAPAGLLRRSLLASLASDERSAISPLCPLSLAVSPSGLSTRGSLGRFAEPAARGFRSLGAVRTPLDVATRGFHATMRLGRYACSAPCDRAPGGFYWLVHRDDLIGAVRHWQRFGELPEGCGEDGRAHTQPRTSGAARARADTMSQGWAQQPQQVRRYPESPIPAPASRCPG